MFNTMTELFLNTYFMFDVIVGKIIGDARLLFDKLYSAFLLPENARQDLFAATQAEVVREIESYADYAQVCRIQKFSEFTESAGVASDVYEMIAVKGGALKKIKQFGLEEYTEGTGAAVCKFLGDTANMGFVSSLCMLGFMQCEGIFVAKNENLGKKNLGKAAAWNSIEGILLSLAYDTCGRRSNLDRLYTVTQGTLYEGISETARKAYTLSEAEFVAESKLLKKAFGAAILKPDIYMPQYARFIFSDVLSFKDKERTLFSAHKEAIAATADLPLKLTCGELQFNSSALESLPVVRKQEEGRIVSIASGAEMRTDAAFRPLCVCADSEYLLGLYAEAIGKAFSSAAHVERIDVADLGEYDFDPTINNIFVRSCDEDRQNVFIFTCKGEIKEGVLNAVKNFLKTDKRKKFRLQHPSAVIDLSAVLPVCFCDRQNVRALKAYCDMVTLASVSESEKSDILSFIMQDKAKKYRVDKMNFDDSAQVALMTYSVDKAENLLDKIMRYNRGGASVTVTTEMLREIVGDVGTKNKYGFGEAGNESKQ